MISIFIPFADPIIISQTDIYRPVVETMPFEKRDIRHLVTTNKLYNIFSSKNVRKKVNFEFELNNLKL
jgi:hypothetical protein